MKKTIVFILFVILYHLTFSQEKLNITDVDKKTYRQYLDKDWKGLIKTGKQAINNNIDFYYLQVRIGIAYYEQKKYAQAINYFEKANKLNSEDELIQEYLYFSYFFSGNYKEARFFKYSLNRSLSEKLNIVKENPFIRALYFETKHNFYEDYATVYDSLNVLEQITTLDRSYYNLSLEHDIGKKLTIFHGYSFVGINNFVSDNTDISLPPQYYENISQNEYYLSMKIRLAKRLKMTTAFHYLNVKTTGEGIITMSGTSSPGPGPGSGGGSGQMYAELYKTYENSFVGFIKLEKSFSLFNTGIASSISNLNGSLQIQPELSFRIYPFGNTNLYSETSGIFMMYRNRGSLNSNPVIKQSIGLNLFKHLWIEPTFIIGDMINFTEYNAFVANNDLDVIKYRFETLFNISLAKSKFHVFAKYQYNMKENEYQINNTIKKIQFDDHSITAGFKWYFTKY